MLALESQSSRARASPGRRAPVIETQDQIVAHTYRSTAQYVQELLEQSSQGQKFSRARSSSEISEAGKVLFLRQCSFGRYCHRYAAGEARFGLPKIDAAIQDFQQPIRLLWVVCGKAIDQQLS